MGAGRSLAETPTSSVATAFVCFLVERSFHRLGKWLHKTKRKAMLASLEKIREELMLLGLISLVLSQTVRWISEICVVLFSCRFYMFSEDYFSTGGESGESHPLNQTDFASTILSVHPHDCDEGL